MKTLPLVVALAVALCSCRRQAAPAASSTEAPQEPDHKELVLQPWGPWSPRASGPKLEMQLLTDREKIRAGEPFRYRLEIRNVGDKPVFFHEKAPSFIKDGSLCGDKAFRLVARAPSGTERDLPCAGKGAAGSPLDVTVLPGEYLLTRGAGGSIRAFRELDSSGAFTETGEYRIRAVYAGQDVRGESADLKLTVLR